MNEMALTMEEFWELFDRFSPLYMIINNTDTTIKIDISALENIVLAQISDI